MIKCIVWDLDGTLWEGVLAEDRVVQLRSDVTEAIRMLDGRGILHSIASRNEAEPVLAQLEEFGVTDYFLVPQIGWGAKSESIRQIAARLNIALDSIAFVDDDPVERAEVQQALPDVLCIDASRAGDLPQRADFIPQRVTRDAARRRMLYRSEIVRRETEDRFDGPSQEFLQSLDLRLAIDRVGPSDLERCLELTERTHQLNTTGIVYSYADLDRLRSSDRHLVLRGDLEDRFGDYGTIGLALLETQDAAWDLRLFLLSCRVMSRGIGAAFLGAICGASRVRGVRLRADFAPTKVNRVMLVTYRFAGFREIGRNGDVVTLEFQASDLPRADYVKVDAPGLVEVGLL